jgi:hypothetical protein
MANFYYRECPSQSLCRNGRTFFAPETVERLQKIIWENQQPKRVMETPVFDFAS